MQAIYYFPSDVIINSIGQKLRLTGYHDEYSLWFGLDEKEPLPRPYCHCSVHLAISQTRLGQLNDSARNQLYVDLLKKKIHPGKTICLVSGDCSLLSLMAARLGALKVYAYENNAHWRRVLDALVQVNHLEGRVVVMDEACLKESALDSQVSSSFRVQVVAVDRYY